MPANWSSSVAARPVVSVTGVIDALIQNELRAITIIESTDGSARCEATFNNWGTVDEVPGYLFRNSSTLDLGKQLQVKVGNSIIFSAPINSITTIHPDASPPTITVLADYKPVSIPRRRVGKTWEVAYGRELREASMSLVAGILNGQAVAVFNGLLRPGDKITIIGIATRFAGSYTVQDVTHSFDTQAGYRTEFYVSKPE
jgi:hypothetical protein